MVFAPAAPVLVEQQNRSDSQHRGLEIPEDMDFQRREWTAQRFGWGVMALLLVTALAGFFGVGPVSHSSAERDGLRLEYERFGRLRHPTTLRFHFSVGERDSATVFVSRKYFSSVQIENVTPHPEKIESDLDWLIYSFPIRQRSGGATFYLKPERFGTLSGEARLAQGEPISFRQFIYP
jgi:hypothetical protein